MGLEDQSHYSPVSELAGYQTYKNSVYQWKEKKFSVQ